MTVTFPSTLILNVGRDSVLLDSRGMLLRSAGYIVESTRSIEDAINRFQDGDFDLVVMCHSIADEERQRFIRDIRNYGSKIPVILVAENSDAYHDRSAESCSSNEPGQFLSSVHDSLNRAGAADNS